MCRIQRRVSLDWFLVVQDLCKYCAASMPLKCSTCILNSNKIKNMCTLVHLPPLPLSLYKYQYISETCKISLCSSKSKFESYVFSILSIVYHLSYDSLKMVYGWCVFNCLLVTESNLKNIYEVCSMCFNVIS